VKDNYFTCYPTLHTFYRLNPATEFQLNYSLRVNRPEGDDLNPFPEYQDPYNIRTGNPYLKPEKIHSVELGWQWKYRASTLLLTPYYRYTFHKMTEITENMGNGVMKTTKENMSSNSASGVEMIFNSGVGKWLSYNLSSNLYYDKIDASDLGYSSSKGAMAWYMSLNANFYATQNLAFQVNSRYNSSTLTPQGHRKATFIMNLGAKYDIPNRNISIIATVTDLLDTYKNIVEINTYNIIQRVERRRNPRTFYIGATYRFGNGKAKKQTSEIHYDENQ
jgi:outer membrane cobalamin receptor